MYALQIKPIENRESGRNFRVGRCLPRYLSSDDKTKI